MLLNGGVDNTANYNRALPLNTIPLVAINGQVYLDFANDLNQNNSRPLLSLDEVQISLASSGSLQGYTADGTYGGAASLVYDMGGNSGTWVKLNSNLSSGSSAAEMHLDVPLSDLPDSAFSGANRTLPLRSDAYVYLYSHFGSQHLNAGDTTGSANDGYEEWSAPALGGVTPTVGTTIYDALTSQAIASPATVGVSVKDGAGVTGTAGTATGMVTFLFYPNSNGSGTPVAAGTVALNASGVANYSEIMGPLGVGSYSFVAHYNGDPQYLPGDSPVEPLVITQAHPVLATTPSPSTVALSTSTPPHLTDSAVLSLGYNPTGTLTFRLYAPDGTTVVDTETVNVTGNGTYATPSGYTLPTSGAVTGTYQWMVSYSGDANNAAATNELGDEAVTVAAAGPRIGTTASPSDLRLDGSGTPMLTDSATLAGGLQPHRDAHLPALRARRHHGGGHRDGQCHR